MGRDATLATRHHDNNVALYHSMYHARGAQSQFCK